MVLLERTDRTEFMARLQENGVAAGLHYPTLVPFQPAYAHLGYQRGAFPVAEKVAAGCVSLPMFPELTEDQIQHVVQTVRAALR